MIKNEYNILQDLTIMTRDEVSYYLLSCYLALILVELVILHS